MGFCNLQFSLFIFKINNLYFFKDENSGKITNLLETLVKAHNKNEYIKVVNLFEENFINQTKSTSSTAQTKITQSYLHLYAESLLNLVKKNIFFFFFFFPNLAQ
jgi:vacuolar-type H+-ATPase subunit B/Vma2